MGTVEALRLVKHKIHVSRPLFHLERPVMHVFSLQSDVIIVSGDMITNIALFRLADVHRANNAAVWAIATSYLHTR